jgi:hypothetical protein
MIKKMPEKMKKALNLIILFLLCFSVLGCDALLKKFTRKPKQGDLPQEQMVLVPEDYPSLFTSKEEEYRHYFLFWQSWQDELINALIDVKSHKKQLSCLDQAIKNILQVKRMLNEEKQKGLGVYIQQLDDLTSALSRDVYSQAANQYRNKAENIKRNILRYFTYSEVKEYLK